METVSGGSCEAVCLLPFPQMSGYHFSKKQREGERGYKLEKARPLFEASSSGPKPLLSSSSTLTLDEPRKPAGLSEPDFFAVLLSSGFHKRMCSLTSWRQGGNTMATSLFGFYL